MTSIVVDAVYEHGTLKLDRPLPIQENQRVTVTVQQHAESAELTYGLIGWTGDPEVVKRIALDPEFGIQESP